LVVSVEDRSRYASCFPITGAWYDLVIEQELTSIMRPEKIKVISPFFINKHFKIYQDRAFHNPDRHHPV
jgi:hypothetical protein